MSKGKETGISSSVIEGRAWEFLQGRETITSGELAAAAGVTRQAAHYHLRQMTHTGLVVREGAGRGTRYRRRAEFVGSWPVDGLQEELVWKEVLAAVPAVATAPDNVRHILNYAMTEMVNNAVDHSGGTIVHTVVWAEPALSFEVSDDGVGAYARVRDGKRLPDLYSAVEAISKGKQTTDPDRHTGEGIFFTSKALDRFELTSNGLRWVVDNVRRDQAIGDALPGKGTVVLGSIAADSPTQLSEVFGAFTDEAFGFTRSRVRLGLFERGPEFISRSEAKRLAVSLEGFEEVEIDFSGVELVGQGFADELFRVWASAHPDTELIPTKMSETVRRQVERARTNRG